MSEILLPACHLYSFLLLGKHHDGVVLLVQDVRLLPLHLDTGCCPECLGDGRLDVHAAPHAPGEVQVALLERVTRVEEIDTGAAIHLAVRSKLDESHVIATPGRDAHGRVDDPPARQRLGRLCAPAAHQGQQSQR